MPDLQDNNEIKAHITQTLIKNGFVEGNHSWSEHWIKDDFLIKTAIGRNHLTYIKLEYNSKVQWFVTIRSIEEADNALNEILNRIEEIKNNPLYGVKVK